jgi:hypothetical protein
MPRSHERRFAGSLRGEFVFVEQAAEPVATAQAIKRNRLLGPRRFAPKASRRPRRARSKVASTLRRGSALAKFDSAAANRSVSDIPSRSSLSSTGSKKAFLSPTMRTLIYS